MAQRALPAAHYSFPGHTLAAGHRELDHLQRQGRCSSTGGEVTPEAFDPVSFKAAKLECLTRSAVVFNRQQQEGSVHVMVQEDATDMASKFVKDELVCLSSYKWLPPSSTETRLLFQTLHRFLVSGYEQEFFKGFMVPMSGTSLKEMARDSGKFDKSSWIKEPSCSRRSLSASSHANFDKVMKRERQSFNSTCQEQEQKSCI
ncbi:hypothetical protein SELMODRAFT_408304 [Selaginella moellendorffii]|uniref:Uncharacterized protein n=1 Tax=Selaginella moellendorffii TaxID=88036 RepID=D8R7V5_SELML|nr:hypothetical protein SELMODRAFT_408304 [Selaginella moellendorffii]